MAARSFSIALAAAALRLSDAYGDGVGVINAKNDIPYRQLTLSASGAAAFVGDTSAVSTTVYGVRLDSTTTVPPVTLGPFETGPLKLSDLWAVGAGATLHIQAVPY